MVASSGRLAPDPPEHAILPEQAPEVQEGVYTLQTDVTTAGKQLAKLIEGLAESGPIELTKYGKVVAVLAPPKTSVAQQVQADEKRSEAGRTEPPVRVTRAPSKLVPPSEDRWMASQPVRAVPKKQPKPQTKK
jgi:antitoxin (DNA-binding transcriptional repressor) of toxin-antitoxin stability system